MIIIWMNLRDCADAGRQELGSTVASAESSDSWGPARPHWASGFPQRCRTYELHVQLVSQTDTSDPVSYQPENCTLLPATHHKLAVCKRYAYNSRCSARVLLY